MPQVVIEIASLAPYEEAATQVEINWANRNVLEPISRRLVELKAGASDFDKMTLGDHPFMWFALVLRRIANNGPVGAEGQDTNSKDPHSVVNALRAAQYFAATRFKYETATAQRAPMPTSSTDCLRRRRWRRSWTRTTWWTHRKSTPG